MKKQLVYLASPYTLYADTPERLEFAVDQAAKAAAKLMQAGYAVFCPVVHSHYIADHLHTDLRLNHHFWMSQDLAILEHCDTIFVLCLPGWRDSKGVNQEITEAHRLRKMVRFILPDAIQGFKVSTESVDVTN